MAKFYTAVFAGETVKSHKSNRRINVAMRATYRRVDGEGEFTKVTWHISVEATAAEVKKNEFPSGPTFPRFSVMVSREFAPANPV